jgi:hypothetical protein
LGEVLAGPNFSGETILTADIDMNDIARSRLDFDAVGHYSRSDVFRLIVDETSRSPVSFQNATPAEAVPSQGPVASENDLLSGLRERGALGARAMP